MKNLNFIMKWTLFLLLFCFYFMLFTVTKNVQEFIVRMCEQMGTFILTQLVFLP